MRGQQADHVGHRRATGEHPSARRDVRDRIAESQRAQWNARNETPAGSGFTGRPSEFRRLILPRLADVETSALVQATGLSAGYCARIRDGGRVPHIRHWAALQLAGLMRPRAAELPIQRERIAARGSIRGQSLSRMRQTTQESGEA